MNKEWLQTRKAVERRCHHRITARLRAQLGSHPWRQGLDQFWPSASTDEVRTGRLVIDGQLFEQTLEDQQDEKERP